MSVVKTAKGSKAIKVTGLPLYFGSPKQRKPVLAGVERGWQPRFGTETVAEPSESSLSELRGVSVPTIPVPKGLTEEPFRKYAILLANCTQLTSALIDTVQLSRMLVAKGYPPTHVIPLVIDPPQNDLWFTADYPVGVYPQRVMNVRELWATMDRLYRSLKEAGPSDLLFVLSSHGATGLPNPKEADGFDEYIVVNRVIVRDDELHDRVVEKLPDNVKLTILVDTCHSGTMFDLPRDWVPGEESRVVCLSACRDDQSAFDAVGSKYGKVGGLINVALGCLDINGVEGLRVPVLVEAAKLAFGDKQEVDVTMV